MDNPLLLPPKLLLRTLDDLHVLAQSAGRITKVAENLDRRAERVEHQLDAALVIAEQILSLGQSIDGRAKSIIELGGRFDTLGAAMINEAQATQESAREVVERAGDIIAALPLLERALEMASPLEGAVERVGRMVDRLPGGRRGPAVPPEGD